MKESGKYSPGTASKESFRFHDNNAGDSDDSRDSDAKELFELPKRKLVRPVSSSLRRKIRPQNRCLLMLKDCCRLFVNVTLPMLIAVFVISTILCLTFVLVGVAGLKQEISLLKIKFRNVDAAEGNFISKREHLRKEFQHRLLEIMNHQDEFKQLQATVKQLANRLDILNATIHRFHDHPKSKLSLKIAKVNQDIDKLKTGMADTGADIERLDANGKKMKDSLIHLEHDMTAANLKIYNMSVHISVLENEPVPELVTTPKTLVVTMTPDEDLPVKRKEMDAALDKLEKKQTEACKHESSIYDLKIQQLWNYTWSMNETYFGEVSTLHHYIVALKNQTVKHEKLIPSVNVSSKHNTTRNGTVLPTTPILVLPTPKVSLTKHSSSVASTAKLLAAGKAKPKLHRPTAIPKHPVTVKKVSHVNVTQPRPVKSKRSYNDEAIDDIVESYRTKDAPSNGGNTSSHIKDLKPLLREYIKRVLNSRTKDSLLTKNAGKVDDVDKT